MQNCLYQKITKWTCTETLHTLLRECLANGRQKHSLPGQYCLLRRNKYCCTQNPLHDSGIYYQYHKP